ncbi:aspartate kinase [Francisella sp. SYW-9]|uniref:aspartate kinase n=1 Tax=Francisella sp. SYW-9 TaxID=2610888 RepID=UPI00123CCDCF|nr:aspartate kinase [Francisella sp. SYW-9]
MKKSISVAKFGGTSVGDVFAIQKCIDIVKNNKDIRIVVVSAQAGVTNLLDKLLVSNVTSYRELLLELHNIIDPIVDYVGNGVYGHINFLFNELDGLCKRLYQTRLQNLKLHAQILAFGERVSAYIFNQALKNKEIDSRYIDARSIIKTQGCYIKARPVLEDLASQAKKYLKNVNKILVMEGFIGSNYEDETTVLGRGGSDYSAALIAEAIKADMLYIWTDVTGIYQADPKLIPESQVIERISFSEAIELASFGAKVLHPDTLQPVLRSGTKVFVGSTFCPDKGGTYIDNDMFDNKSIIKAVTERAEQTLINIRSLNENMLSMANQVLFILKKYDVNAEVFNLTEVAFSFVFTGSNVTEKLILKDLAQLKDVDITSEHNLLLTTIIGNNLDKIPSLLNNLSESLGPLNIKLSGYGATGKSLYLLNNTYNSLEKVYKELF